MSNWLYFKNIIIVDYYCGALTGKMPEEFSKDEPS